MRGNFVTGTRPNVPVGGTLQGWPRSALGRDRAEIEAPHLPKHEIEVDIELNVG